MTIIKKLAAAAALTVLATAGAQAAGLYVGAGLGLSNWGIVDTPGASTDKKDTGVKFVLGTQISPNFAVEGGYVSLGKAKLSATGVNGSIKGSGLFIDLVGIVPISGDVSVFGKIGAFRGKASASVTAAGFTDTDRGRYSTNGKFGFGVSYALSPSVDVRGEWERYRLSLGGEKGDVSLLSVGVNYKF